MRYGVRILAPAILISSSAPVRAQEPPVAAVRVVRIAGARALSEKLVADAARGALPSDRPADLLAVRAAIAAVVALYRSYGYALAQVSGYEIGANGDLTLTVAEGRVRRILIRGNRRTREAVLRVTLTLRPGDVYREDVVREDRNRLARLGIFDDVSIAPRSPGALDEETSTSERDDRSKTQPSVAAAPSGLPASSSEDEVGLVDLVVRVKERQTGNVAATVGYADQTGLVGFVDVSEDNLFGTAQQLSVQWQRAGRVIALDDGTLAEERPRMAFQTSFGRPALGRRGIGYMVSVYDQSTIFLPAFGDANETIRTYERRRGGEIRAGVNIGSLWSAYVSVRNDRVGYDPIPLRLNPPLEALEPPTTVGALGWTIQADRRDNADNPGHGFLHRLDLLQAGRLLGGDRRFAQAQLDLRQYLPLGPLPRKSPTLAFRLLGGTSTGKVPLPEQFFLGGFELLRGYDLFSIWGDRMTLATAEVRLPLGQGLSGVAFLEAGDAWDAGERPQLHTGAGVGLRFASPIGPIRFDVAYGSRLQTYISLGQSF